MNRVKIEAWGSSTLVSQLHGTYAMRKPGETNAGAVSRSIARRLGLDWCVLRVDSSQPADGLSTHYVGSLGRWYAPANAWSVHLQLWFSVKPWR